jgi:hypothetical protein
MGIEREACVLEMRVHLALIAGQLTLKHISD